MSRSLQASSSQEAVIDEVHACSTCAGLVHGCSVRCVPLASFSGRAETSLVRSWRFRSLYRTEMETLLKRNRKLSGAKCHGGWSRQMTADAEGR